MKHKLLSISKCILVTVSAFLFFGCSDGPVTPEDENALKSILPEEAGYSSAKLLDVTNFATDSGFDAMMVLYDGKILFTWGKVSKNYCVHSIRKPFLSALYGIHISRGNINLDATIQQLGIDDIPPSLTAEEKQATVRDLIKSRSGIYHLAAAEIDGIGWTESRPERGSHPPDTFFYYNNWDFNTLGTIFEQQSKTRIFEEFKKEIADPIGMEDFEVSGCNYQYELNKSIHPAYVFYMSTRDMARFGALYQKNGNWNGKQIVPQDWIAESTKSYSIQDSLGRGYGYMWNIIPQGSLLSELIGGYEAFYHTGLGGVQGLVIIPKLKLVIVQRTDTDHSYINKDLGMELGLRIIDARLNN